MAATVKELAIVESGILERHVKQQLDDTCAVGLPREGFIQEFTSSYRGISNTVGVSLADLSDKEKAFNLESVGTVLGLEYDIPRWKVAIPEEKQARFMRSLIFAWQENGCIKKTLRQIVGKIEHYSFFCLDNNVRNLGKYV